MKSIDRSLLAIDLDFAFLHEEARIFEQCPQAEAVRIQGKFQFDSISRPAARDGHRARIRSDEPFFARWYVDSASLGNAHTPIGDEAQRGSSVAAMMRSLRWTARDRHATFRPARVI
jgi:hypothetical protein